MTACPGSGRSSSNAPPTGTMSPTAAPSAVTVPATGAGSSTSALSVCTETTISSRATWSPTATCHRTTSASVMPSPRSGSRNGADSGEAASGIERDLERGGYPLDVGTAPVFDQRRGGRHVVTRYPPHRRLQRPEGLLLDGGHHLGAESRGERCLVHDDDPAGLFRDGRQCLDVEWHEGAKVDDADVSTAAIGERVGRGARDVHHRSPGDDDRVARGPHDSCASEWHDVLTLWCVVPCFAVAGDRLHEEHRIGVAHRAREQAFGVGRVRRDDHLQAGSVRVGRLDRVGVQLGRAHPATVRGADGDWTVEAAAAAVAQAGELTDDLVIRLHTETGELDLSHWYQSRDGQSHARTHDCRFRDRRVEHPLVTEALE